MCKRCGVVYGSLSLQSTPKRKKRYTDRAFASKKKKKKEKKKREPKKKRKGESKCRGGARSNRFIYEILLVPFFSKFLSIPLP